jgi:hypothetical protein
MMAFKCEKCELPSLDLIKYVNENAVIWICIWCHIICKDKNKTN